MWLGFVKLLKGEGNPNHDALGRFASEAGAGARTIRFGDDRHEYTTTHSASGDRVSLEGHYVNRLGHTTNYMIWHKEDAGQPSNNTIRLMNQGRDQGNAAFANAAAFQTSPANTEQTMTDNSVNVPFVLSNEFSTDDINMAYGSRDPQAIANALGKDLPNGVYISKVLFLNTSGSGTNVQVNFKDSSGNLIGTAKRNIDEDRITHLLFRLDDDAPPGIGSQFMQNSMNLYKQGTASKVDVSAGLDTGGYVWARMGFTPDTEGQDSTWSSLGRQISGTISWKNGGRGAQDLQDKVSRLIENRDINGIACLPEGKELLAGTYWDGSFDLKTSSDSFAIFNRYMSSRAFARLAKSDGGTLNEAEAILRDIEGPAALAKVRAGVAS